MITNFKGNRAKYKLWMNLGKEYVGILCVSLATLF